jgi:hypothetical protein
LINGIRIGGGGGGGGGTANGGMKGVVGAGTRAKKGLEDKLTGIGFVWDGEEIASWGLGVDIERVSEKGETTLKIENWMDDCGG